MNLAESDHARDAPTPSGLARAAIGIAIGGLIVASLLLIAAFLAPFTVSDTQCRPLFDLNSPICEHRVENRLWITAATAGLTVVGVIALIAARKRVADSFKTDQPAGQKMRP